MEKIKFMQNVFYFLFAASGKKVEPSVFHLNKGTTLNI